MAPLKEEQMEYTTIRTKNKRLADLELQALSRQGWQLVQRETERGRYGVVKTGALGLVFLPLALAGRKKDQNIITLARPVSVGIEERAKLKAKRAAQWKAIKGWFSGKR